MVWNSCGGSILPEVLAKRSMAFPYPMDFASVNNGLIDLVAVVTVFNPGHDAHLFSGVVGMDIFFPLLWFDRDGS